MIEVVKDHTHMKRGKAQIGLRVFGKTPPPGFIEQLKKMDRNLNLGWDPGKNRWLIAYKGRVTGNMRLIMYVQNPDGSFRDLGPHVFTTLRAIDTDRVGHRLFIDQVEADLDAKEKEEDYQHTQQLLAAGEKVEHALQKDLAGLNFGGRYLKQEIIEAERLAEQKLISMDMA